MVYGDVRNMIPKICEILIRYFDFPTKMKCHHCKKSLKFNKTSKKFEYPLVNNKEFFFHLDCSVLNRVA